MTLILLFILANLGIVQGKERTSEKLTSTACKFKSNGALQCVIIDSVSDPVLESVTLPEDICKEGNCENCVKGWRSYFLSSDKKLRRYQTTRIINTKMSNFSEQLGTMYYCENEERNSCSCESFPCDGSAEFCKKFNCGVSQCKCRIAPSFLTAIAVDQTTENEYTNPLFISFLECLGRINSRSKRSVRKLESNQDDGHEENTVPDEHNLNEAESNNILTFSNKKIKIWFKQPVFTFSTRGSIILRKQRMETIEVISHENPSMSIPVEFMLHAGPLHFTFISHNGNLLEGTINVRANELCLKLNCIFCMDIFWHVSCLPYYAKLFLSALTIILLGIILKYVRSLFKSILNITFFLYFTIRMLITFSKRVARIFMSLGVLTGIKLKQKGNSIEKSLEDSTKMIMTNSTNKKPKRNTELLTIAIIMIFALAVADEQSCDTYQVLESKTKNCMVTKTGELCNITTAARVSMKYLQSTACLYFKDSQDNFLASIILKYDSVQCDLMTERQYFTFPTELKLSSSILCPQHSDCSWLSHCKRDFTAPLISDEARQFPGESNCFPISAFQSSCLILHARGCMMYRYYIYPDYQAIYTVNKIKAINCWPKLSAEIQTVDDKINFDITNLPIKQKGITAEILGQFQNPLSFLDLNIIRNLRDPKETYLSNAAQKDKPDFRKVGAVQADHTFRKDFLFDKTGIKCQPLGNRVRCSQQESPLLKLITSNEGKLPLTHGFLQMYVDHIGVLKAKQLNPGAAEVFLRFRDYSLMVKTKRVCPEVERISEVKGCFDCKAGAAITLVAKSHCMAGMARVDLKKVVLLTAVVNLSEKPKVITIYFSSTIKCIDTKICLFGNDMSSCAKVKTCLDDPTIVLTKANTSFVSSISKVVDNFSLSDIFSNFKSKLYYVIIAAISVIGILVSLYIISAVLSLMRRN